MEYIVIDCEHCGGWCCKSLNRSGVERSYWISLKPDEVIELNPWIPVNMSLDKYDFCKCQHLDIHGLCKFYTYRDEACRNYPNLEFFFMEYLEGDAEFYVPFCTYRSYILQAKNIPFEVCLTGEECQQKYLEQFRSTPEDALQFHGSKILLYQAGYSCHQIAKLIKSTYYDVYKDLKKSGIFQSQSPARLNRASFNRLSKKPSEAEGAFTKKAADF